MAVEVADEGEVVVPLSEESAILGGDVCKGGLSVISRVCLTGEDLPVLDDGNGVG